MTKDYDANALIEENKKYLEYKADYGTTTQMYTHALLMPSRPLIV